MRPNSEVLREIDDLVATAKARMDSVTYAPGLVYAEICWMTDDEVGKLHELKNEAVPMTAPTDDTEMRLRLIVMAEQSGLSQYNQGNMLASDFLIAFAQRVAEDCAGMCGDYSKRIQNQPLTPEQKESRLYLQGECGRSAGAGDCRNAIVAKYGLAK